MNLFDWIRAELCPPEVDSTRLIYDHMDSQSGRFLPIIYQPFDMTEILHWADRGACWDFYHSVGDGRLLDFGPGDGWPSLLLAPLVEEVIGVDASARRVQVCRENARRLGIDNAEFLHVPAEWPLPFADELFDGITAASAVEQTPDPQATLRELCRVLKPGGKLRLIYDALGRYRDGREHEIDLWALSEQETMLFINHRSLTDERVDQYMLLLQAGQAAMEEILNTKLPHHGKLEVSAEQTKKLAAMVKQSGWTRLLQPSGATWQEWLLEAGFSEVAPTQSGNGYAARLYEELSQDKRPTTLQELDDLLRDQIESAAQQPAPIERDPWLTATK